MLHILKVGNLPAPTVESLGDYEVRYTQVLRRGGYTGEINFYETRKLNEYPNFVDTDDTILVSGSGEHAGNNDEFTLKLVDFLKLMISKNVKLLGVCFGHQVIARALGAQIGRADVREVGVSKIEFTESGTQIFKEVENDLFLQQIHDDQVFTVPNECTVLASSELCPIQSYYKPHSFLTTQGHPEFNSEIVCDLIKLNKNKDGELLRAEIERAQRRDNGIDLGFAFARFVNGEL